MTDQQFGDAMSCRMGREYINTPAMDSLAKNGVIFRRAYTPNPLCKPARSSIFTGRYPHEVGVTYNTKADIDKNEFVCMGTYFRDAGYETTYFGKWHLCFKQNDIDSHGFITDRDLPKEEGLRDEKTAAGAVRFLSQKHNKPFLLVVSFLGPHGVCQLARGESLPCGPIGDPPPPEECPPVPANLAPPVNETDGMTLLRKGYQTSKTFPVGNFSESKWRQFRWGYYRIIEKVDAQIGRVLTALRKANLDEETLIIFTSDHGECAGAHRFNQKTVFYEESVRVPLIINFAGKSKGGVSDHLVNTGIDILPTMFDFAGMPVPKRMTGRSLRPIATGLPVPDWRNHIVVENHLMQTGIIDGFRPTLQGRMVRTDHYKYCVYDHGQQRESLVDFRVDPLEMKNVALDPKYRPVILEHRELLQEFAKRHRDKLVSSLLANDVETRNFPEKQ